VRLLPAQRVPRLPIPLLLRDLPRCSLCPLFDAERAIRDVLGENPPPGMVLEITLGPSLQALLRGELPPHLAPGSDPGFEVPDFPPEEWEELAGEEPPG
jgi:hypothetical protein